MNKVYELMWKDEVVGTFNVHDENESEYSIQLDLKVIKPAMADLIALANDSGLLNTKAVNQWINNRVTPRTQEGVMEKLENIGITEYSPWIMFTKVSGRSLRDNVWVKFNKETTFKDHIRSNNYKEYQ